MSFKYTAEKKMNSVTHMSKQMLEVLEITWVKCNIYLSLSLSVSLSLYPQGNTRITVILGSWWKTIR